MAAGDLKLTTAVQEKLGEMGAELLLRKNQGDTGRKKSDTKTDSAGIHKGKFCYQKKPGNQKGKTGGTKGNVRRTEKSSV